jgi:hypothetical protein
VLCDLADAGGIRQIPLKELDAEFYGGFIAFLLVDVDDDDARADFFQRLGGFESDAARASGDDGDAVVQI